MNARIALVRNIAVASSLLVVGCLMKERTETTIVKHDAPGAALYLAGSFQGTFAVGKSRVRVGKDENKKPADKKSIDELAGPTELIVAKLDSTGAPEWMRSFSGLAPGRAVLHSPRTADGLIVVGVFSGNISFDNEKQKLSSEGKEGVFVAEFSPKGQVRSAVVAAMGGRIASPELEITDDKVIVNVPYENGATFLGRPVREPGGKLRFSIGSKLELSPVEPAYVPPKKGELGYRSDGENGGLRLASMMQGGTCNVCVTDLPKSDPDCSTCRSNIYPHDKWCTDTGWDHICMDEAVYTYCRAGEGVCTCPHSTCVTGPYLHPACTIGGSNACVNSIDTSNRSCGNTWWSDACVGANWTYCGGC